MATKQENKGRGTDGKRGIVMEEYSIGEYIIYRNGEKYELGRIKSLREDGAFVAYHEGETGAKTPYDCMHKLINGYCIKETLLGGDYFRAEQTEPQTDYKMPYKDCEDCETHLKAQMQARKDEPQTEDAYAYQEDDWYDKTEREGE